LTWAHMNEFECTKSICSYLATFSRHTTIELQITNAHNLTDDAVQTICEVFAISKLQKLTLTNICLNSDAAIDSLVEAVGASSIPCLHMTSDRTDSPVIPPHRRAEVAKALAGSKLVELHCVGSFVDDVFIEAFRAGLEKAGVTSALERLLLDAGLEGVTFEYQSSDYKWNAGISSADWALAVERILDLNYQRRLSAPVVCSSG
jgi:hypothetical protein